VNKHPKKSIFITHKIIKAFLLLLVFLPFFISGQDVDMNEVRAKEEFHYGVDAFNFGLFAKALQSLEKALSYQPDNNLIKTWLGKTYYRMGFEDAAISIWNEVIASGKGSSLLENKKKVIEQRRGLGRELQPIEKYVVHSEIDANAKEYYHFKRPSSVVIRKDGTFYVVAYGSSEIINLNANSLALNIRRGGLETFDHPFDLIETDNYIFVSEFEGNRISKYTLDFQKIKSFGEKGIKEGQFLGPQFLALDENGYLYVTDWGNGRVSKFDLDGNFILSFGGHSQGFPDALKPTGIAIQGDKVYVADQKKARILVFDLSGNFLANLGEGVLSAPEGLLFYDQSTLFVADTTRIMKLDLVNEVWTEWSDISNVAKRVINLDMTANGDILACDFDLNKVFIISNMATLYTGYFARIDRVDSRSFPSVTVDINVEDWYGRPIVGLTSNNFFILESQRAISEATLASSSTDNLPLNIIVLIENSAELIPYRENIVTAIKTLRSILAASDRLKIITVSDSPFVNAEFGSLSARTWDEIIKQKSEKFFRLDLGMRKAIDDLLPFRGKKAVIYFSGAKLPVTAFKDFSLDEITNYTENNGIVFYPIYFAEAGLQAEINFMAQETKGKAFPYFNPGGIKSVIDDLRAKKSSTYILTYTSPTDPEFGERYIDLAIQVMLYNKTGKDESGYFSPRKY
jgi:DNA-binding beta-propeller fold protein YncE